MSGSLLFTYWLSQLSRNTYDVPFEQVKRKEIKDSEKKVDEILIESRTIVKEDFFKEHERDHFQGRIHMIDKRNKGLEEKAAKEERRYKIFRDFLMNARSFKGL